MFDPFEAMKPGAPVLHDYAPDNVTKHIPIRKGDVEAGFAQSDLVVEQDYDTQAIEHAYLEPEAGLGYVDHDGVVTIVSPSQNITHHRHMLAKIIAKPISKVRFIMSPVGGGFGGKEDMIYQGMLALMAMKTRRPVRLVFTREELIATTAKRHPSRTTLRMGLTRDGRIQAVSLKMICDGGAYGLSTEGVMRKAAILGAGPYNIPNLQIDTFGIYTNNTPSGAFRSFGALQTQFATESHLDICAEKLGLDPFEIRRINAMRDGAQTHTKQQLKSVSYLRVLEAAERGSKWEKGAPVSRGDTRSDLGGRGRARRPAASARALRRTASWRRRSNGTQARTRHGRLLVRDRPHRDGRPRRRLGRDRRRRHAPRSSPASPRSARAFSPCWRRSRREELGVRPEDVTIGDNDTARSPEAAHAGATRQTYMIGNVVALASREAFGRLAQVMANEWDVPPETIEAASGEIWAEGTNHRTTMDKAVHLAKSRGVVPLGSASFGTDTTGLHPVDGAGRPWQAYVFGCQVAEVEVDTVTGEVQVLGIWAAHDVGRAVNPSGVEGQIEGGIVQALGQALMEDYKLERGHTTTPGFAKYILPTSLDVPHVTSIIVEDPDPIGPLGVKGIGEPAMVPTIPAIMNAIYDAVGVRITSLPATPEKVLMAIRDKERARARATRRTRRRPNRCSTSRHPQQRVRCRSFGDPRACRRSCRSAAGGAQRGEVRGLDPPAQVRDRGRRRDAGDHAAHGVPGGLSGRHGDDRFRHGQGDARFLRRRRAVRRPAHSRKLKRALDAARMIVLTHYPRRPCRRRRHRGRISTRWRARPSRPPRRCR